MSIISLLSLITVLCWNSEISFFDSYDKFGIFYSLSSIFTTLFIFITSIFGYCEERSLDKCLKKSGLLQESEIFGINNEGFYNKWFILKRKELRKYFWKKWSIRFFYLFLVSCFSSIFGLTIASFSPGSDIFGDIEGALKGFYFVSPSTRILNIGFSMFWGSSYLLALFLFIFVFNFVILKINCNENKIIISPFQDTADWLEEEEGFKKDTKKILIKKELFNYKWKKIIFLALKMIFLLFAILGSFLALKSEFQGAGGMLSINSIIGENIVEIGNESNENIKKKLQRLDKEISKEFLQDFLKRFSISSLSNEMKSKLCELLNFLKESERKNNLILDCHNREEVENFLENEDAIKQFIKEIKVNWDDEKIWKKINNFYDFASLQYKERYNQLINLSNNSNSDLSLSNSSEPLNDNLFRVNDIIPLQTITRRTNSSLV